MNKEKYNIITAFECGGIKMLIVGMGGAACIMPERDYNRIIIAERKYNRQRRCRVA